MSILNFRKASKRLLSFELFPPKTPQGETSLFTHVEQLNSYSPDFFTCTYGAGGSTREKTLQIVSEIKRRYQVTVASHLTLVGSSASQLREYLQQATEAQIDGIVALRGDPPAGTDKFAVTAGGYRFANELVELIQSEFNHFTVAVAGYPETHREAETPEIDMENLKRKVDAGADLIITQLFYDNADFFRFRDKCQQAGIDVPIMPGLLPITQLDQVQRITSLCGATLPRRLLQKLSERSDADWHFQVGVNHAIAQVDELVDHNADGIHFYVLNRSQAVTAIMSALSNEFQAT